MLEDTLRVTGHEKKKQKESAHEVLEAMYQEMDYLNARIDEIGRTEWDIFIKIKTVVTKTY